MRVPFRWFWLGCAAVGLVGMSLRTGLGADEPPSQAVKLESLKWPAFKERLASIKNARYTLVDAWATTCGPCKENFPHLMEMHRKYGDKGLAVISLSLDDPSDAKAVAAAEKFLQEKKADLHPRAARRELWRRLRQAGHQHHPRRLPLRPRRQGSETVHHG